MALVLSMVALTAPRAAQPDELASALARDFPAQTPPTNFQEKSGSLKFDYEGYSLAVGTINRPIAWQDLAGPCATSPLWPDAAAALRGHHAHHIVALLAQKPEPLPMWIAMTRVVASLAVLPETVGIYWGTAGLVHSPEVFRKLALEMARDRLPVNLWINVRLGQNPDGTLFAFTTGLAAFDYRELEVSRCAWPPQQLADRMYNIAHYVLDREAVLEDGQTIGMSEDEKITISIRPSLCGDDRQVVHLEP